MAEVTAARRATGYVAGGISPLGQKRTLPIVLDVGTTEFGTVFRSGGRRGLQVELAPADLAMATNATVVAITAG